MFFFAFSLDLLRIVWHCLYYQKGNSPKKKRSTHMKQQTFGVEIELTGITRKKASEIIAKHFGTTSSYYGGTYSEYRVTDNQGRTWKAMYDSSIHATTTNGDWASDEYKCEIVTPVCKWDDIVTIQEIVRELRHAGAVANDSCGIHVHVGAEHQTAKTLRNLVNIMTSKEDLLFKALGVTADRQGHWCQKNDEGFVRRLNQNRPTTEEGLERLWYNGSTRRYSHYDYSRYHALNLHSLWQGKGIEFRCFNGTTHAGKIKTYIQICLAICNQAMTQTCATVRRTKSNNEKYTFRTWLLRMGMIGKEFESARKHLLANLDGDIAFKNGRPVAA